MSAIRNIMRQKFYQTAAALLEASTTTGDVVITRALLFYEGKHVAMDGTSRTFKKEALEKIVNATNDYLSQGRRIKLYASDADHQKISQVATIGYINSQVELKEITAEDLPLPGLEGLIGKWGIFAEVAIAGQSNIESYRNKLLKELSIGLGSDNIIYEVSAVSIPALAGAALFGALLNESGEPLLDAEGNQVRVRIPRTTPEQFALTLTDQIQEDNLMRQMDALMDLWWSFMDVMRSIQMATAEQLAEEGATADELRARAVEDFIGQLRARLNVPAPSTAPAPLFSAPPPSITGDQPMTTEDNQNPQTVSVEQFNALQQQFQAQQKQLKLFGVKDGLMQRFNGLRARGETLRSTAKITPAHFKDLFEKEGTVPVAIAQFSATGTTENVDALEQSLQQFERSLIGLEFLIENLEKHAQPITQFGSALAGEPLPTDAPVDDQAAAEFMKGYTPKLSYSN